MMKLGKQPFIRDSRDLMLSKYVQLSKLPTIPDSFGHDALINDWKMLGNDSAGDCVIAGAFHLEMLWNAMGQKPIKVEDKQAIDLYSSFTGYNPLDPSTDNGTNMRDFLKYWRANGIVDESGKVHKIIAFLKVDDNRLDLLAAAMYLFGGIYTGIEFPDFAMTQFEQGKPWEIKGRYKKPNEGHCIPLVRKDKEIFSCVTWGRKQPMTSKFILRYMDEAWIVVSDEMLIDDCTPEGFLKDDLLKDLKAFS